MHFLAAAATAATVIKLATHSSIDCKIDCKMHGYDEWICIPSIGMSLAQTQTA
jgi:hypothetical protein